MEIFKITVAFENYFNKKTKRPVKCKKEGATLITVFHSETLGYKVLIDDVGVYWCNTLEDAMKFIKNEGYKL